MKRLIISALILMLVTTTAIGCGTKNDNKTEKKNKAETTESTKNKEEKENKQEEDSNGDTDENTNNNVDSSNSQDVSNEDKSDERVAEVKNYIINGQNNLSEAEKIQWSESFLNSTDIKSLYNDYIKSVSNNYDVKSFAEYITKNAPILSNWQDLFKKDVKNAYGQDIVKIESLGGDMYEAYINNEGNVVPYVGVNARTGYYHG